MINLTKMTLEEVREIVEGTADGREVRINANDGENQFPIHGAIKYKKEWCGFSWDMEDNYWDQMRSLITQAKINQL